MVGVWCGKIHWATAFWKLNIQKEKRSSQFLFSRLDFSSIIVFLCILSKLLVLWPLSSCCRLLFWCSLMMRKILASKILRKQLELRIKSWEGLYSLLHVEKFVFSRRYVVIPRSRFLLSYYNLTYWFFRKKISYRFQKEEMWRMMIPLCLMINLLLHYIV